MEENIYLVINAASRIAMQTSRKGTSFVSVKPCNTLGSTLDSVEADVQGVGRLKSSSLFSNAAITSSASFSFCPSFWKRLNGPCEPRRPGMCGLKRCFFSSPSCSDFERCCSPSQTSISIQRQPRRSTFSTDLSDRKCNFVSFFH